MSRFGIDISVTASRSVTLHCQSQSTVTRHLTVNTGDEKLELWTRFFVLGLTEDLANLNATRPQQYFIRQIQKVVPSRNTNITVRVES